jgi:hypothetical protein
MPLLNPDKNELHNELDESDHPRGDFVLVIGQSPVEYSTRLCDDLENLGFSAQLLVTQNLGLFLQHPESPVLAHFVHRARIMLIVWSQVELDLAVKRLPTFASHFDEILRIFFGIVGKALPCILLVHSGNPPAFLCERVPRVDIGQKGNTKVISEVLEIAGKWIAMDRLQDSGVAELRARLDAEVECVLPRGSLGVMVFGPARPSATVDWNAPAWRLYELREAVRSTLEREKYFAVYGEDLEPIGRGQLQPLFNPDLKERLFAKGAALIIVICGSVGAVAEIGAFSQYEELCSKLVVVISKEHGSGFVRKGPVETARAFGARVIEYEPAELAYHSLLDRIMVEVKALFEREVHTRLRLQPRVSGSAGTC